MGEGTWKQSGTALATVCAPGKVTQKILSEGRGSLERTTGRDRAINPQVEHPRDPGMSIQKSEKKDWVVRSKS